MTDKMSVSQPLLRLLKQYELSSSNSLRGPSADSSSTSSTLSPIRPNAERPLTVEKFGYRDSLLDILATISSSVKEPSSTAPLMTPRDHSMERHETLLEGEVISCFVVGGEKRLCLPQLLNAVLRDYSLQEINKACTELHVHCSQCSKDQLEVLKVVGVLPMTSSNCGLITKTDAERLCNFLSHSRRNCSANNNNSNRNRNRTTSTTGGVASSSSSSSSSSSILLPVYHECFGRCRGRYVDEKYTSVSAECIECVECNELYAPDRFVLHSHRNHETRTCHWGFDSANWRAYLHLAPEIEDVKEAQVQLENMKTKFHHAAATKRHYVDATTVASLPELPNKRLRYEQPSSLFDSSQLPIKIQASVPIQFSPTVPSVQPLLLCDPLLMAYYHALANSRLNLCSAYPSSLLPFMSTLTTGGVAPAATSNSAVEEAAAALLKLAPATSKDVDVQIESSKQQQQMLEIQSPTGCYEPLKKHILHRTQSQHNVADDNCQSAESLEALLCRYVNDAEGLRVIKTKLDETRTNLDRKLDSLTAQNRILQQEIAFLRNKQQNASMTTLTTVSP